MSNGDITTNAKPGAATPGFARTAFRRPVAKRSYNTGLAGANARLPVWLATVDCFARGLSLLWGGLQ